jgi:hypothetical protein
MRDAAQLYGLDGLQRAIAKLHPPPDRFPTISYHGQAEGHFFSICEAAEGEEFVLTNGTFDMWESLAGDRAEHYIILFVISPRIAMVLRNVLLRPELRGKLNLGELKSILLHVDPEPETRIYASRIANTPANIHFKCFQSMLPCCTCEITNIFCS